MSTKKKSSTKLLLLVSSLWIGGICAGTIAMLEHGFDPGKKCDAPLNIPPELTALSRNDKPLTVFIAVHPDCPCTGASLEQLDHLLARNPDSVEVVGIVRANDPWQSKSSSYWKRLEAIPNAHPVADPEGKFAALLGTYVSGSTVAYGQRGNLLFQGGVTASRGHAGPSQALDDLESIARQLAPLELCSTPIFGCSLENDSDLL